MGILTHFLNQVGKIVVTHTDKHGDQVSDSVVDIKCRFRYITEVDRQSNREGIDSSDAIVWVDPEIALEEGSIIFSDDKYWRVNKLIKGRRMGSTVEFLKAFVKKHSLVENE